MRNGIRTNSKTVPPTTAVLMNRVIHSPIDDDNNGVVRIALKMKELP